jgi:hypothetical protein
MNFKETIAEWVEIKKQLQAVRGDIKTLNQAEKRLREQIRVHMKQEKLTGCNVTDLNAKISLNTRIKKPSFTKDLVRKGLHRYFEGNEDRVEYVMGIIEESGDSKETDTVTLKIAN